jgi:NadR type nicotinamide-nucleotide adenylyltransferase
LRVAILGAESSGKSTLAAALASHFGALWVPEYLREVVDTHGRVPQEEEQLQIAHTQLAREAAAAATPGQFVFCDTTPLMTALYSRWYWGRVDPVLALLEQRHEYAHTLVTAPDSPWVFDGLQRESEAVRQAIHEQLMHTLARRNIDFLLVTGSLQQRVLQVASWLLKSRTGPTP